MLQGLDLKTRSLVKLRLSVQGLHQHLTDPPLPRGTCTATRPSQANPKRAEHTLTPAQDLEAFKADMTSMLSDMLQASLSSIPALEAKGTLRLRRLWFLNPL